MQVCRLHLALEAWCHVFRYVWFPFSAAVRGAFQPQAEGHSLCQSQPQQIHGH